MGKQIAKDITGALPCPFCGEIPSGFYMDQGYKWGGVQCCCQGPDVRTGYDDSHDASWHIDAVKLWNKRA